MTSGPLESGTGPNLGTAGRPNAKRNLIMTIAGNKDGTVSLLLNLEETKAFLAGKAVVKESGDARGVFQAVAKIVRPRRLARRTWTPRNDGRLRYGAKQPLGFFLNS